MNIDLLSLKYASRLLISFSISCCLLLGATTTFASKHRQTLEALIQQAQGNAKRNSDAALPTTGFKGFNESESSKQYGAIVKKAEEAGQQAYDETIHRGQSKIQATQERHEATLATLKRSSDSSEPLSPMRNQSRMFMPKMTR